MKTPSPLGLLVEFIGVTGVGKSTLMNAARRELIDQDYRFCEDHDAVLELIGMDLSGRPKWRSLLVHLIALPLSLFYFLFSGGNRFARLGIATILRDGGTVRKKSRLLRNFMKRLGVQFLLDSVSWRRHYDFLFCDEGMVHLAHNVFVHTSSEPDPDAIAQFAELTPKPDVLIWVTAPQEQSVQCTLARGHSRVEKTEDAARRFVQHAQTTFDLLNKNADLRMRTFRIDNTMSTSEAIRERAAAIIAHLTKKLRFTG